MSEAPERINRFSHPILFPLVLYPLVCFFPFMLGWMVFVVVPGGLRPDIGGLGQVVCACYPCYWVLWVYWQDIQHVSELPIPRGVFTRSGFRTAATNLCGDPRRSLLASAMFLLSFCIVPLYIVAFAGTAIAAGNLVFLLTGSIALAFPAGVVTGLLCIDMLRRLAGLAVEQRYQSASRRPGQAGTHADAKRNLKRARRA